MGTETNVVEYEQAETDIGTLTRKAKKQVKATPEESDKIRLGIRAMITAPLLACEKLDRMFGSGSEAIVHHMWLEAGQSLFSNMIKCNPLRSPEELLSALIEVQPRAGWGNISMKIIDRNPPMVDIIVKNPPVKTVKGSQKYMIGSFWAGVLSRYFNRQLMCKNFSYDAEKDEFSCTVTI